MSIPLKLTSQTSVSMVHAPESLATPCDGTAAPWAVNVEFGCVSSPSRGCWSQAWCRDASTGDREGRP